VAAAPASRRLHVPAWPWAILLVALVVRVAVVVLTPGYTPFGDPADYDRIGRSVWFLGTYPPTTFAAPGTAAALRPPAYPYLLAGLYDVFGIRWTIARGVGALLGVLSVGLLWAVVRRLGDERLARWAAGVAAVAPSLVWLNGGLVAETLFVPAVLGAVLAALRARASERAAWWLLGAGALLGLAVLARSNGAILVLPLLAAAWVARRRLVDPVALLVGVAVVLTPWTVRNAESFGAFAPLGTQSGFTLIGAYNDQAATHDDNFAAWRLPGDLPAVRDLLGSPTANEAEIDGELRDRALRYAADHPGFVAAAAGVHALQLFQLWPDIDRGSGNSFREMGVPERLWGAMTVAFWVLLVAAVAGVVLLVRRRERLGPRWLWAVPVLIVLSVVPLLGPPRYRVPADPFLAVLAGVAAMAAWDRLRAGRGRGRAPVRTHDGA
jgi:4-amino-4-deoxy-L-arabinose transferase-like glycosyltransferase